jgi:hypothetical protein
MDYLYNASRERRNIHALGSYNGQSLDVDGTGRLDVWDDEEHMFGGVGDMSIRYNARVRSTLTVGVLGCIIGSGTGVLVEVDGNIWLANPKNAFGKCMVGKRGQVMLIKKHGESMKENESITVLEVFDNVDFHFKGIKYGRVEGDEDEEDEEEEEEEWE